MTFVAYVASVAITLESKMTYLDTAREVLATLSTVEPARPVARSEVSGDEQTNWWSILTPEEREALKPHPIKRRCPWCKRIKHSAICDEMRPKRLMPLGKYKGQAIEGLPRDYVHWLAGSRIRLDQETRDEIYGRFGIAIHGLSDNGGAWIRPK